MTPQACIDAIDFANDIFTLTGESIQIHTGVNNKKVSLDAAIEKPDEIQPKVQVATDAWMAASDECRSKQ